MTADDAVTDAQPPRDVSGGHGSDWSRLKSLTIRPAPPGPSTGSWPAAQPSRPWGSLSSATSRTGDKTPVAHDNGRGDVAIGICDSSEDVVVTGVACHVGDHEVASWREPVEQTGESEADSPRD